INCSEVGRVAARNVEDGARMLERGGARLIFVLQPNIVSTPKRLSEHERSVSRNLDKSYWDACYESLRDQLGRIAARNYQFLDLSRLFGELDERNEVFIDSYHFADQGGRLAAQALLDRIDWTALSRHSERAE